MNGVSDMGLFEQRREGNAAYVNRRVREQRLAVERVKAQQNRVERVKRMKALSQRIATREKQVTSAARKINPAGTFLRFFRGKKTKAMSFFGGRSSLFE
jgi:hypothetical protein